MCITHTDVCDAVWSRPGCGHERHTPPSRWFAGQSPSGVGRAPMRICLSVSQTHTSASVHTDMQVHTCMPVHACARSHTLSPAQRGRHSGPLHVFASGDGGAREARWPRHPSSWTQLGRMPIFKGCAAGPAALPPRGRGPAPPPGGPGSSCAQSWPAAPRKLHDVTQPDRRKEQAPQSCKMQEKFPGPGCC